MSDSSNINEDNVQIDNSPPADIVAISRILGEFSASGNQRVEDWLEKIETLGMVHSLKSGEMISSVILSLRGQPHKWAINKVENNMRIEWDEFKTEFEYQFATRNKLSKLIFRITCFFGF